MTPNPFSINYVLQSERTRNAVIMCLLVLLALSLPSIAFAQTPDASDTITATCGFANNINKVLNAISVVVVTVAVVFSGYQIAFAHKRFAEVAPVLIGAILIGAASQIANMFLKTSSSSAGNCTVTSLTHFIQHYA